MHEVATFRRPFTEPECAMDSVTPYVSRSFVSEERLRELVLAGSLVEAATI